MFPYEKEISPLFSFPSPPVPAGTVIYPLSPFFFVALL